MALVEFDNQSASGIATPGSGYTSVFVDASDKKLKTKDDTGAVTDYSAPGNSITQLTGEVTAGPGPGSVAATVSNAAVIGKVLTGYTVLSGNVSATDTILQAIGKLSTRSGNAMYGAGTDGDQTITVDTTLVKDMYYNNLTINAGATVFTAGYRITVYGTLTLPSGAFIKREGNNGVLSVAGAAQAAGTLPGFVAGGAGQTGAGTAGTAVSNAFGGSGGAGGAGVSGGGGAGVATVPAATVGGIDIAYNVNFASVMQVLPGTLGTGAGGGGGGGGAGVGFPGGGGGSAGGVVVIRARSIAGAGTVSVIGGNGGAGTSGGGNTGGGGGGGGGVIVVISDNDPLLTTTITFTVTGGIGGPGGASGASGANGANGRTFFLRP